jgi:hypothetical protein
MRLIGGIAALATLVVLAGCGSDPETTQTDDKTVPETSQESSPEPDEPQADPNALGVGDYMEAVNSTEVDVLREAAGKVAENSPAAIYLEHRANVYEATLDGGSGQTFGESTLTETDSGYDVCTDGDCIAFADFTTNDREQLVDFTINGEPIGERLGRGNGRAVQGTGGVKVTYLTSYLSVQSDAVFVTARVETGNAPVGVNIYTASYRSPDGKQRAAQQADGPVELGAKSNAMVYMAFPGVPFGGTVTLDGCVDDCAQSFEVQLKTK